MVPGKEQGWVIILFIFNNAASTVWLQWSLTLYVAIGRVENLNNHYSHSPWLENKPSLSSIDLIPHNIIQH